MYKKLYLLLASVAVLTLVGIGCKGVSTEEAALIQPVTLNYWTVFNDVTELKKFADEYKKIRPHVAVNIRQVRYEEFDRLFANALADDVGPDIASMHVRWLRRYQSRLSPMPKSVQVSRLVQKGGISKEIEVQTETFGLPSVNAIRSDYVKAVSDNAVIAGNVYGLPIAFDTLALYYNKDLLDRAGVPEPPRTWEEFVEAVKKSTKFDNKGKIVQAGTALGTAKNINNAFDLVSLLMAQSGVKMAQGQAVAFHNGVGEGREGHPVFKALNFYTDFAEPQKEVYSWNEQLGNSFDEFARGKVVFYFGNAFDYKRLKSRAPDVNVGIVPVPQLNAESPTNIANFWVESVVNKSKQPQEAWDFVRFITSPERVKQYTDAAFRPTPLRAQIRAQQENPDMAPFVSQVLFAENWYRGKDADAAIAAFTDLITRYHEPAPEGTKPRRDAQLINTTAQIVQQTM